MRRVSPWLSMTEPRRSLRARIAFGLLGYALLIGAAIGLVGYFVIEAAERIVWSSLLEEEMNLFEQRRGHAGVDDRPMGGTIRSYARLRSEPLQASVPLALEPLAPGLHEDLVAEGLELVVLVRDSGPDRLYLALDITDFEQRERYLAGVVAVLAALASAVLVVVAWLAAGRLLRPLYRFAQAVQALGAGPEGAPLQRPSGSSRELLVIADAIDGYSARQAERLRRERAFADSLGHELRTPIAVIAGAAELVAARPDLPPQARPAVLRIQQTAEGAEQLVTALLVLARDPDRLAEGAERVRLDELLPEIVEDHRHLCRDKALEIRLGRTEPGLLAAPLQVLQVAIGNLLRNALENSDHGEVLIEVVPAGVVRIRDPGQGMSPEEIARLFAARARGGQTRASAGIGLELIHRIAEHLGWHIELSPRPERGTEAVLDLRASLVGPD